MNSVTAHGERVWARKMDRLLQHILKLVQRQYLSLWIIMQDCEALEMHTSFFSTHFFFFLLYKACYVLSYYFYYILVMMGNTFRNFLGKKIKSLQQTTRGWTENQTHTRTEWHCSLVILIPWINDSHTLFCHFIMTQFTTMLLCRLMIRLLLTLL